MALTAFLITVFGLIFGSFLNVCIYRIPRAENFYADEEPLDGSKPVEKPESETPLKKFNEPARSICPKCENLLYWWHNIPVFSWVILRGKCWFCKEPISSRYIFVEVLTVLLALLTYNSFNLNITSIIIFFFCASLLVISFIDYDFFIIPNVITYPGFLISLIIVGINQFLPIFQPPISHNLYMAFWGVLAGAGFLFFVSEVYLRLRKREGLGMGDVKLLAVTGALFGPECALYSIFLGSLFGSVLGLGAILIGKKEFSQHLPFGPYLAVGTLVYLFYLFGSMHLL